MESITDRTLNDVIRLRELAATGYANLTPDGKALWDSALKGAYNVSDMNRVETNVQILQDLFILYSIATFPTLVQKTWTEDETPTVEELNTYYLDKVKVLRDHFWTMSFPALPGNMNYLDHMSANNIEKVLQMMYDSIQHMANAYVVCGAAYSGGWYNYGG